MKTMKTCQRQTQEIGELRNLLTAQQQLIEMAQRLERSLSQRENLILMELLNGEFSDLKIKRSIPDVYWVNPMPESIIISNDFMIIESSRREPRGIACCFPWPETIYLDLRYRNKLTRGPKSVYLYTKFRQILRHELLHFLTELDENNVAFIRECKRRKIPTSYFIGKKGDVLLPPYNRK